MKCCAKCSGCTRPKKLLPVRTGLVAKSITSPEMFRYRGILWLVAAHAHCSQYMRIVDNYGCSVVVVSNNLLVTLVTQKIVVDGPL